MKKLLLYLFLITAGLISTVQVSAQKEIAPGVIKLQKGEIESTGTLLCRGFLSSPADGDSFSASNGQRMVPAIRPLTTI